MKMTVIDHGDEFVIRWDYHPKAQEHFLRFVKEIGIYTPGEKWEMGKKVPTTYFQQTARFEYEKKQWVVPREQKDQVLKLGEKVSLLKMMKMPWAPLQVNYIQHEDIKPQEIGDMPVMPELRVKVPIKGTLRHYQEQGIQRILDLGNCIVGDQVGLGKTVQSIGAVVVKDAFPCLIVCPSVVVMNWVSEWHKFTKFKAIPFTKEIKDNWAQYYYTGAAEVFVITYDLVRTLLVKSMPKKNGKVAHSKDMVMDPMIKIFQSIIVDELHNMRNPDTIRAKTILRLTRAKPMVIGLTGTAYVNSPKDLYPQLCIVNAERHFGSDKQSFLNRYCLGGSGASNLKELNYKLNKFVYFKRTKEQVAKDLPPLTRRKIVCNITTRQEYNKARASLEAYLKDSGKTAEEIARSMRGEIMVQMMKLKQISARGKLEAVKEYLDDMVANNTKVVVFCNLHEIVDAICDMFPGICLKITGKESAQEKFDAANLMNTDPKYLICVVNIKAGGVGVNLPGASQELFVEIPWHPTGCKQCEGRCHRLTSVNPVNADYMLGLDTIDQRMFEIVEAKLDESNEILGEDDKMEMQVVTEFLKAIRS